MTLPASRSESTGGLIANLSRGVTCLPILQNLKTFRKV
jgi:hypothetical protein